MNVQYFTSLPGLLKPVIFIVQFLILICLASVADNCGSGWAWFFWLVLVVSIIVIVGCSVMILVGIWDNMPFNKAFGEFAYSAAFASAFGLCGFICLFAAVNATGGEHCNGGSAYGAATFFYIIITGLFGLNTFGHYTMWKSDEQTMPGAGTAGGPMPHGGV